MLAKTHRAFGFAALTGTLALTYEKWELLMAPVLQGDRLATCFQIGVTVMGGLLGSTLPDIDQKLGGTHRGITHAIWIPLLLFGSALFGIPRLPISLLNKEYAFGFLFGLALGWLSHLIGDAFSTAGIAWFYPIGAYRRYPSGAFTVKGARGPFQPIYRVGDRKWWLMRPIWWIVGCAFLIPIGKFLFPYLR